MPTSYSDLQTLISEQLECWAAHFDFSQRHSKSSELINDVDDYVASLGLRRLGQRWRLISHKDAIATLGYILHHSLCYGSELLPRSTAEQAAKFFVQLFDGDTPQFLTNCDFKYLRRSGFSWTPLTDSTADVGIVGVDEEHNGIICIEDED